MALANFAEKFSIDPQEMENTLKTTVFKQSGDKPITNEQMVMLMVVADQYNLNPFTKEIYAFPDKQGGVVPVVGVDGWSRLINSNKFFNGMEFRQSEAMLKIDGDAKNCPEWMEVVFYRKDRDHPVVVREYLDEVYRPGFKKGNYTVAGPWQSHTKRMLRHKAMIQGARIAFGFAGIYDDDEAERIMETNRDAIIVEGVEVEQAEQNKPVQSKAEAMTAKISKKQPKNDASEAINESKPDITARGKAALKGKISKCKDLKSLRPLQDACMEFQGSDWFDDLTKTCTAKKAELENG